MKANRTRIMRMRSSLPKAVTENKDASPENTGNEI